MLPFESIAFVLKDPLESHDEIISTYDVSEAY